MSEDANLSIFKRRVDYFDKRAGDPAFLYFPQACQRSQYPNSFTPSGLYRYGDTVADVRPNYDILAAQPINWDKPTHYYTVNETFWPEFYKNNTTIYDRTGQIPYNKTPVLNGRVRTVTGYRKPSIESKQIWLSQEKYMNEY